MLVFCVHYLLFLVHLNRLCISADSHVIYVERA